MKKILFVLIIFVIAIVIAFTQFTKSTTVKTASPTRGTIQKTVNSTGNLQAGGTVNLYANATGIITKLYVQNGDTVVRGQKIADIQSTATESDIIKAKAAYQDAQATYKTAQITKTTLQSQLEAARKTVIDAANAENAMEDRVGATAENPSTKRTYTQEEIDSIRSSTVSARQAFSAAEEKYKSADLSINAAQSALQLAKLNLDATKDANLKANADGTILNLAVQEGDKVQVGAETLTTVPPLAVITDLSKYAIKLTINETRIADIQVGQIANIVFDSQKDATYTGIVRTKDTIGTVTQGLVSYAVYITPSSLFPTHIQPGMTAEVAIVTQESTNALLIPQAALQTDQNQSPYVMLIDPVTNQTQKQMVTIGISSNGQVEITSELPNEARIVLPETADK